MTDFTYFNEDDAPFASKPLMQKSRAAFGMLPNLHKILAGAPITYEAYLTTFDLFFNQSSFTRLEAQVVFMTANVHNRCHYCTAGHSMGMSMEEMPEGVICDLRDNNELEDPKLRALQQFVIALLDNRGHINEAQMQQFLDAGYSKTQALEVLCGLASKLISNFTNAMAKTDLDDPMQAFQWQPTQ
ncbi:MAG: carboxymuconolactone decarboxylase family protein [Pseudomonadota bacterium]